MMVRLHMHESFDLLRSIERLLIRGHLEEAKRFAETIAGAPDERGLGPWVVQATLVRARAATLGRARTLDDACRLEASLAAACASCHVDAGVAIEFRASPPPPPDGPSVMARMQRHRWAADRLWEAIVGGVEQPWRAGLDVLAAAPLDWKELAADRAPFGLELRRLAQQALRRELDTPADRATAYGEILVACAGCHTTPTR